VSQAKFAAARELIQEKNYEVARAVLKTINDPSAVQWLQKLEQLAPEMPVIPVVLTRSPQEEKFYRTQNRDRRRRRLAKGIRSLLVGSFVLLLYLGFASSAVQNGGLRTLGLWNCLLPLGILGVIGGLIFLFGE
jgi:hypothetical protein